MQQCMTIIFNQLFNVKWLIPICNCKIIYFVEQKDKGEKQEQQKSRDEADDEQKQTADDKKDDDAGKYDCHVTKWTKPYHSIINKK